MGKSIAKEILKQSADVKAQLAQDENTLELIEKVANEIIISIAKSGKLVLCGNGGSAADAQHISTELTHQFEIKRRKAIPSIALTTNTSTLTAIGNDWGFDEIFSRQVEAHVTEKDVFIAISTSGNSPNLIKAMDKAREQGAVVVGLLGNKGGMMKDHAHHSIIVPSDNTARVQESHICIGHILCKMIEDGLGGVK